MTQFLIVHEQQLNLPYGNIRMFFLLYHPIVYI